MSCCIVLWVGVGAMEHRGVEEHCEAKDENAAFDMTIDYRYATR